MGAAGVRAAAPFLPPRGDPSFAGAAVVQSQAGIIFSGGDQRCRENSDSEADLAVARQGGAGQRCPPQRAPGVGGTGQGLGTMALVGGDSPVSQLCVGSGMRWAPRADQGEFPRLEQARTACATPPTPSPLPFPPPPTPCPRSLARLSPPQRLPEKQTRCLDAGQALQTAHPHPSPGRLVWRLCKPTVVLPPPRSTVPGAARGLLLPPGAQPKRPAPISPLTASPQPSSRA